MSKNKEYKLKKDKALKMLVQPLSENERKKLKSDLHMKRLSLPVRVWNMTILVDYDMYEIYRNCHLAFSLQKISINNMEEAIIWICKNQILREDITDEMRRYIIGKRYNAELLLGKHSAAVKKAVDTKSDPFNNIIQEYDKQIGCTCFKLGAEYHVHPDTIKRYGAYAKMIDKINGQSHETAIRILKGTFKISYENLVKTVRLSDSDFQSLSDAFKGETSEKVRYMSSNEIISQRINTPDKKEPFIPVCSVKDTPDFDPDAEIASLALTIPSWISSINRVLKETNMSLISPPAREKLKHTLDMLRDTVQNALSSVKENEDGRL